MPRIRVEDVCEVCKKKSMSMTNFTTSGSLILLLTECFKCGYKRVITRRIGDGKTEGLDIVSSSS